MASTPWEQSMAGSIYAAARSEAVLSELPQTPARIPLWHLLAPLALLALEIALLTPLVEFNKGAMKVLASPEVASCLLLFGVLYLLLARDDLVDGETRGRLAIRAIWLIVNWVSYLTFCYLTHALHRGSTNEVGTTMLIVWILLVSVIGASAVLTFFTVGTVRRSIATTWHKLIAALLIAATFAYLTEDIQRTWNVLGSSASRMACALVSLIHGKESPLLWIQGDPVIGYGVCALQVTKGCAEMESIAAFLLLGVAVLVSRFNRIRKWRFLLMMLVGLEMMYLLNAVRLAFLVELGYRSANPSLAVNFAHSRLSGIFFLALAGGYLTVTRGWWDIHHRASRQPADRTVAAR